MNHSSKGFTLLEMMVVIAVIGILAAIVYPNYDEYIKRGKRTEGQTFLTDLAARQERYFVQNNRYVTTEEKLSELYGLTLVELQSSTGLYVLSLDVGGADDGGYVLTAVQQFTDRICGDLTLNALGDKGRTGSANNAEQCWR